MNFKKIAYSRICLAGVSVLAMLGAATTAQAASLFDSQGPAKANAKAHITSSQDVKINRGALNQSILTFELDGEAVTAVRQRQLRGEQGNMTWIGHVQGNPGESVVITARGNVFSGVIQTFDGVYEISGAQNGIQNLEKLDLSALPPEDTGMPDDLSQDMGSAISSESAALDEQVQQDIIIVYTQNACNAAGSCGQLEADITTTIAQMNQAYIDSGIDIHANVTSMRLINFADAGESTSSALSKIRSTSDGVMDEVHGWRDADGADLVSLIMDGSGCGTAYTTQSASYGFNVTDESCMLGNRTLSHEIGHNQYALHDRDQHGGGVSGDDRYGYKRCSDGSDEDFGSPYFRTIMSYSCSSAGRVGRFSNPNRTYLGVPYGVDPVLDPARGAFNVQQINETAASIAAYRAAIPTTPPNAPSGLSAGPNGYDAINLTWTDNADNETRFAIERSDDNISFAEIASVGSNVTAFTDNGLSDDTTYYYRVEAINGAGSSGYSNTASAATDPLPATIDHVATSATSGGGTVSGSYTATQSDDGAVQQITETSSGGPKRSRRQSYSYIYSFDVLGGAGGVVLNANAWVSGIEGANFEYSADGGSSWHLMFTADDNNQDAMYGFVFPGETSGNVLVRASDAEQVNGEGVDSVSIDSIVITSNTVPGTPPAAPTGLAVTAVSSDSVTLSYSDMSSDEFGFEIWRGTVSGVCQAGTMIGTAAADETVFTDNGADPETTYFYDVSAFNGAGSSSACAGEVSVTTGAAPNITASASGYKVKGAQTVDLTWNNASGDNVDIRREGVIIASPQNTGSYTDPIGAKGGGSYSYQVCETGSGSACSSSLLVVF